MTTYIKVDQKEIEEVYDNYYFKLCKNLQICIGLWPYRTGLKIAIQRSIVYSNIIITLFPLVNGFRTWCGKNMDLCCENTLGILYLIVVLLKYLITIICETKMKKVYKKVATNWLTTIDPEEKAIMKKYAERGRIKAIAYFLCMVIAGIGVCNLPLTPVLLDFINPLNESREKILFVKAEYVIDPYEHYFKLHVWFLISAVITICAFATVDVNLTVVAHQSLGIFSVVRHRLTVATASSNAKSDSHYDKIIQAIILHREAVQFIDLLETSYSAAFLIMVGYSILFVSTSAVISMSSFNRKVYYDMVRVFFGVIGCIVHMFYVSWPGQMLLDHSQDVFVSIYSNEWYNISPRAKVLLKIFMLRCLKPCMFTAGGLYIMNFENYGMIVKSAVTYMTVALSFLN